MKKQIFVAALLTLQLQNATAQSWQAKQDGLILNRSIIDISAPDIFNAYATVYDANDYFGNSLNEITATHDRGNTWKAQVISKLDGHRIMGVNAASGNLVHVISWNYNNTGSASGGKVVRSKDGGNTWSQEAANAFTSPESFPDNISFIDNNNGVMFGDPVAGVFEVYTTSNGGNTWNKVPAANLPVPITTDSIVEWNSGLVMEKIGNNTFVTSTLVRNNYTGTIYYGRLFQSDDKGKTWVLKNAKLPISNSDVTLKFRNSSVALLKNDGKLYKTTDGGKNFSKVNINGQYCGFDLDDVPGKSGWWISTGGDVAPGAGYPAYRKGSSISYDDGTTWKTIDTILHTCVEMVNFATGYSGGISTDAKGSKGVYVYSPGFLDIIKSMGEETVIDNATILPVALNIFPNPSTESFSITLNSPYEKFAMINVVNMQGSIVSSQRIVPVGTISFGADLAPGIYTAEVFVGSNKSSFQIVKQ
jgi:photosystem II stability/assembly factor-like uncharacterized protein